MFNSALIYELAVPSSMLNYFIWVDRDSVEYLEAGAEVFDYFIGAPSDLVPMNSILREFVGGSCFKV